MTLFTDDTIIGSDEFASLDDVISLDSDFDEEMQQLFAEDPTDPNPNDPLVDPNKDPAPDPVQDPIPDPDAVPDPTIDPELDPADPEPDPDATDAFQTTLTAQYEILKSNNILLPKEDFEFDGTTEKYQEVLNQTRDSLREQVKQSIMEELPENLRPLFDYTYEGGTDTDKYQQVYGVNYEEVDISSPETQEEVLTHYYAKTTKMDKNGIERLVGKSQDLGTLEEDATDALENLKALNAQEKEQLVEEAKVAKKEKQDHYLNQRKEMAEKVKDLNYLSDARKSKVIAFHNNIVTRNSQPNTEFNRTLLAIGANAAHKAQLADILFDYSSETGFNLERFKKLNSTTQTNSLKDQLEKALSPVIQTSGAASTPPTSNFNWEEFLKQP